jgi:hypothetical protein
MNERESAILSYTAGKVQDLIDEQQRAERQAWELVQRANKAWQAWDLEELEALGCITPTDRAFVESCSGDAP